MIILITDRDRQIILHLEKYKYATLDQIQKIFFKEQTHSYTIARRRMAEIRKAGYVKSVKDVELNKLVYIYNDSKIKPPDRHRLIVLDVLATLHYNGFNVQTFDVEKFWQNGAIRSDAITVFTLESNQKRRYQYFIEVQLSNNECNLEKYDVLYKTGEVQEYLGRDIYPRILLVTDREINSYCASCTIIKLNTKLDEFVSVIMP